VLQWNLETKLKKKYAWRRERLVILGKEVPFESLKFTTTATQLLAS
jgi:hypothetical protein